MMKFAHIFNYSYLIGFAIFKCGSEYETGRRRCRRPVLYYMKSPSSRPFRNLPAVRRRFHAFVLIGFGCSYDVRRRKDSSSEGLNRPLGGTCAFSDDVVFFRKKSYLVPNKLLFCSI